MFISLTYQSWSSHLLPRESYCKSTLRRGEGQARTLAGMSGQGLCEKDTGTERTRDQMAVLAAVLSIGTMSEKSVHRLGEIRNSLSGTYEARYTSVRELKMSQLCSAPLRSSQICI